jgi:hypothetical protein
MFHTQAMGGKMFSVAASVWDRKDAPSGTFAAAIERPSSLRDVSHSLLTRNQFQSDHFLPHATRFKRNDKKEWVAPNSQLKRRASVFLLAADCELFCSTRQISFSNVNPPLLYHSSPTSSSQYMWVFIFIFVLGSWKKNLFTSDFLRQATNLESA